MSVPTIEAKSLSSLTALASNPPAYPRNPTHIRHEPLVLYIARVPGSRDVFLSPMKPREKVVTAEDIQSSLYFIHVEQPEDAQLMSSHFREPQYAVQGSRNHEQPPTAAIQRKAVGGGSNSPVRKPVPGALAPASNYDSRQNVAAGNYSQRPNTLGPDYSPRNSVDASRYSQENVRPTASPRISAEQPQSPGTALTLIRRDPASGVQWNVARIEDPSVLEVSSSTLHEPPMKRKIGAPLYIEVYNPGYSKFLHSEAMKPELLSRNSDMSTRTHQTRAGPPSQLPDHLAARQPTENENIFRRRLWMEGAQIPNGGFGHRKNSSYDYSTGRPDSRNGYDRQTGRPSMDTRFPTSPSLVSRDDQAYESLRVSESQPSFRGYVFTSPWNGRCEFITGGGGGSLKCRHIIPGLQGAPTVAMQVSELRFNLPGSSKAATPRGEESSKRSSFFHRGRHSRHNSSVSISQENNVDGVGNSLDRLDLSLGQEFAGGGFGGKQAKLGKIVLEDEGLKMIDLLVAANVGLWWRAYEKASAA